MTYLAFISVAIISISTFFNSIPPALLAPIIAFLLVVAAILIFTAHRIHANSSLKYEFITIIAHKFRTPLTEVEWIAENLLSMETDEMKKQDLETLRKSNKQLINLTSTLIELADSRSSNSSYTWENFSLCELIRESTAATKAAFPAKNISCVVEPCTEDIIVHADKTRLEFVLQLLLENAFNYTPSGGNIHITVRSIGHMTRQAEVTITDDGIGIEKRELSRIFSKFYRAPNAQSLDTEGLGVGLFLAQSITKRLHGSIHAYSAGKNKGSTFTVIVPRVKAVKSK